MAMEFTLYFPNKHEWFRENCHDDIVSTVKLQVSYMFVTSLLLPES